MIIFFKAGHWKIVMSKASLLFHYSLSEDKVSFYMFPISFSPRTPAAVFTFSVGIIFPQLTYLFVCVDWSIKFLLFTSCLEETKWVKSEIFSINLILLCIFFLCLYWSINFLQFTSCLEETKWMKSEFFFSELI